jgi:hypothetical protein
VYLVTIAMVILLRDFGPCGIILKNICVITVTMVMLLRDFGPYGIMFMTMTICVFVATGCTTGVRFSAKGRIFSLNYRFQIGPRPTQFPIQ